MKFKNLILLAIIATTAMLSACFDDLNTVPLDDDVTLTDSVFSDPASYRQFLAKLYAGLALTGQSGPDGQPDIQSIDEGFSHYLRMHWYLSELTTDEAVIAWNDLTIQQLHEHRWASTDPFVDAFYRRVFFQVALANEFLRESTVDKLNQRGIDGATQAEVLDYRNEARFLRALAYFHALDLYGDVPFVTEDDALGTIPKQISRAELFTYLENELLEIEADMKAPGTNEYGRADKAAAWMLLSKLYLNAEVYTGSANWDGAIKYSAQVIGAGYTLDDKYEEVFLADNDKSPEIIFPVLFDGNSSRTWGGTTFIIHAGVGGTMDPAAFGVDGGWNGIRTTSALVNKFAQNDARGNFYTDGQTLEIEDVSVFTDGYPLIKFKNITSDGHVGKNLSWVDTDFPLFRLADAYLIYAEGVARGGAGGDAATATGYVNALRERAYGDASGNITPAELTPQFILDERARELAWEGHRRNDLIRFGQFTGGEYLWPWKGGSKEGEPTSAHLNLFPIPASDLAANPNLEQNTGY